MTIEQLSGAGAPEQIIAPEQTANAQPEAAEPENNELDTAPETAEEGKEAKPDPDKSIKRLEKRIDRVTAARYQAEARAQQAEERLRQLEQQRPSDEQQPAQKHQDPYELAKVIAKVEKVNERSNEVYQKGVEKFGEAFKDSVRAVMDEAGALFDNGLPTPLGEAILESKFSEQLLHHLGQNLDEAEALRGKTAVQIGRYIESLERDISQQKQPSPSKAPKPLEPVKASAAKGTPRPGDPEYIKWKMDQIGAI
jgi:hypothetical protein